MSDFPRAIVIDSRFQGPPGLGNGGYAAGVIAGAVGTEATVTLRAPIPLDTPLGLARDGGERRTAGGASPTRRAELRYEGTGTLIAEAVTATLDLEPPPAPDRSTARAATARYRGRRPGPYQECFVCGYARAPGSGLRIFAGPTGAPGHVAAEWVVHPGLAGPDGTIPDEFLWGALDCPGAYAVGSERPGDLRLGRMTARISGHVRAGEHCIVAGWRIGSERRKHFTGTAVLGEAGNLVALASSIWIEPRERAADTASTTAGCRPREE